MITDHSNNNRKNIISVVRNFKHAAIMKTRLSNQSDFRYCLATSLCISDRSALRSIQRLWNQSIIQLHFKILIDEMVKLTTWQHGAVSVNEIPHKQGPRYKALHEWAMGKPGEEQSEPKTLKGSELLRWKNSRPLSADLVQTTLIFLPQYRQTLR